MPIPFNKPAGVVGRFAVVKPWPDVQAAEDENIARLQITARSMGLECVVVDPEGVWLEHPERRVNDGNVDFVINLHFETPKAYDAFSFVALWNPLRFFKDWGYRRYSRNLLTHDDFLSCSSTWADSHVKRMIAEDPGRLPPLFTMYHSLSEPIFEPARGHGKVFYAGINWDKLGKKKGRHQDLLLDLDKLGILRIHGPRIFNNVNVWEGYKCYVGPVPFDGVSMIKAISEAGIALVFSSDAHKESELMSNRLFESLAAGAVIICDDNPFARRHFGDTLLYVDASGSVENVSRQIQAHHAWIHANPEEALAMARASQAIFKERFTLDRSLATIYTQLAERKAELRSRVTPPNPKQTVNVLLTLPEYSPESLDRLLESVDSQDYEALQISLLVDAGDFSRYGKSIEQRMAKSRRGGSARPVAFYERRADGMLRRRLPIGRVLAPIIEALPADAWYIALTPNERWFANHVSTLVHALQSKPDNDFAYSTSIIRHTQKGRETYELLEHVNVACNNQMPPGFGRFLLKRAATTAEHLEMMHYLDMRAVSPVIASGDGAATLRATTLVRIQEPFVTGEYLDDLLEQHIVEDRFRGAAVPDLRHIQPALVYPDLVTSLQANPVMTFQSYLLQLQAANGAEASAVRALRQLRESLLYELFHHEAALARCEQAAARLPRNVITPALAEVSGSDKCDTLLAYWAGLHHEAAQKPMDALRAFNRALINAPDSYPSHYTVRTALKAASMALRLGQAPLVEKLLKDVVLKIQPANRQAHAMLDKMGAGKGGERKTAEPKSGPSAGPSETKKATPPQNKPAAAPVTTKPAAAPLVSAIVSTYNSERFMRGCLEDLQRQTIADKLEIIVVDSNSPQNERAIVEEFQKRYSNIVYIRTQERETLYGAWNRAVKAARGKYLTSANTDDRHRKDALEVLARNLDQHQEVTLAYADCLITEVENETFENTKATRQYKWLDFNAADLLLKGCFVGPQPMWRRDAHEEHGYFEAAFVAAGDYEFWLRLAQNRKFLHVRETLGLYLESPTSVEHANAERGAKETWEARNRYGAKIVPGFKIAPLNSAKPDAAPAKPAPAKPAAVVLPPCGKIGHLAEARELARKKQFRQAWEATIAATQQRPFHPEAFLLLAEIARSVNDGQDARACAEYARRIAPGFKTAKQFLNYHLKGGTRPEWMTLPGQMANSVPKLSVGLIVKNEEKFLGQCLKSVAGLASQIIVVDTGSTDRTVEIAREHGAEVHTFTWCDDFSAARNAVLEHVAGDWVLMLDADEELSGEGRAKIAALMADAEVIAWRLPMVDVGREADGHSYVPRLFRNAPGLFYVGRVHEQVFSSIEVRRAEWGLDNRIGDATLIHHGYSPEVVQDRNKIERNLKLLELAITELPDEPHLLMNFGLELARSGREADALVRYQEAFAAMSSKPAAEIVPELRETLLTQLATRLLSARRFDDIGRVFGSPLAKSGSGLTASHHFTLGLAHLEAGRGREAAAQMELCLQKRDQRNLSPINAEIMTAAPHHCRALALARAGDTEGADKAFQAALAEKGRIDVIRLDYARFLVEAARPVEALQRLHEAVNQNARHAAAWQLGGEIALSQPQFLEFARDWTSEAMRCMADDTGIAAQRAEALLLSQDTAAAAEIWARLCKSERQPRSLAALVICEICEGAAVTPLHGDDDAAASNRAFLNWYKRLVTFGARDVIVRLNERVELLRAVLPEAARIVDSVVAETERGPVPA